MGHQVESDVNKRAAMVENTSELIARFVKSEWLMDTSVLEFSDFDALSANNRTALLATVGLTIAGQLARIADALEADRGE